LKVEGWITNARVDLGDQLIAMATARQFEDLNVWRDARELVRVVYSACKRSEFHADFGLRSQICRAAVSTMSNIAEGFERGTRKEFLQFLNVAKASNAEVRSQFYVALDQGYLPEAEFKTVLESTVLLSRKLSSLIRYLETYSETTRTRKAATTISTGTHIQPPGVKPQRQAPSKAQQPSTFNLQPSTHNP